MGAGRGWAGLGGAGGGRIHKHGEERREKAQTWPCLSQPDSPGTRKGSVVFKGRFLGVVEVCLHPLAAVEASGGETGVAWETWMRSGWVETLVTLVARASEREGLGAGTLSVPTTSSPAEKEELQMLFFSETLAVVSNTGEPQGELTIEVQSGKQKDQFGIMSHYPFVHASCRSFMDKTVCGNSLQGRVPAA